MRLAHLQQPGAPQRGVDGDVAGRPGDPRPLRSGSAVRAIVLRGAGDKAFVSGLDISEFETAFSSSATAVGIEAMSAHACARIEAAAKPAVAMINGFCLGAGIQIASSCDLRIATDTAMLAIPAARLGVGYPASSINRWWRWSVRVAVCAARRLDDHRLLRFNHRCRGPSRRLTSCQFSGGARWPDASKSCVNFHTGVHHQVDYVTGE
jgi:hypothetical protein